MKKLLLAAAVTGLLLAGGLAFGTGSAAAGPRASNCTAEATKALIRSFVGDYNTGRLARIDQLWAPAGRFQWFSSGPPGARLGQRAHDRTTLISYFRARVREHERILITKLGAGYDPKRNIVNFGGKVMRRADGMKPRLLDFKGAADCVSGGPSLIVWSM
jgi:hypothetical protein